MKNYPLQYALQSVNGSLNCTYNQFYKYESLLVQYILDHLTL